MIRSVWVVPSIDRAWGDECIASLQVPVVVRVDNSVENRGVPASWNIGARAAFGLDAQYLVVCSEALRFGAAGGRDFDDCLQGHLTLSASTSGFHLVGISTEELRVVGLFDESFWPGYWEETDWLYRAGLAGMPSPRENTLPVVQVPVDVAEVGVAHAVTEGLVRMDWRAAAAHYEAKWGGPQGAETFRHPYDHAEVDWTWCPNPAPDQAAP